MIMNSTIAPLLLAAVPAAGLGYQLTSSDATLAALGKIESSSSLSTLRAGAPVMHTLAQADRAQLQSAEQSSGGLESMRAGALTDHELLLIGITVLAVILLIIIL